MSKNNLTHVTTLIVPKKQKESDPPLYAYVGPSLPRLKHGTVLKGTLEEIKKHYEDEIKNHNGIVKLIVPVSQLAAAQIKVKISGNALNAHYVKMEEKINE